MGTVHNFPQDRTRRVAGNGGDDGTTYRLKALEEDVREIKNDLKGIDSRLHAVEGDLKAVKESLKHTATKEAIQRLKVWALTGAIGGMGLAAGIARLFSGSGGGG